MPDLATLEMAQFVKKYVIDEANRGNKLNAIKNYRLYFQLGLTEAKDQVETLLGQNTDTAQADAVYIELNAVSEARSRLTRAAQVAYDDGNRNLANSFEQLARQLASYAGNMQDVAKALLG